MCQYLLFMILSLTDTTDMKIVEILEVFVMYVHVLNMEACLYEILNSPPPSIVIIKEGTNGRYSLRIHIPNCFGGIAHGV